MRSERRVGEIPSFVWMVSGKSAKLSYNNWDSGWDQNPKSIELKSHALSEFMTNTVFWNVKTCSLIVTIACAGISSLRTQKMRPEDEGSRLLRNLRQFLPYDMTSHPVNQFSSATVVRTERSHLRLSYLHQITGLDTMVFSIPVKIPRSKTPPTGPQASLGPDDWTIVVRFSAEARYLLLR